jgi:uncharacterized protein
MAARALLLTPGASADRNQAALVAIEGAVAPLPVSRIDFGRTRSVPKILAVVADEVAALASRAAIDPHEVALGGRSMGGRMCSMAVAGGLPAAALVLVSYPLHPPGKPDRLRVEHLPELRCPCLFVSGTRDAFGTPDELEAATAVIPGPVTHVWIDGKDHGLRGADQVVAAAVRDWLAGV